MGETEPTSGEGLEPNAASPTDVAAPEPQENDRAALVDELEHLFQAVDRVLTMMRVYPRGHPLLDDLAEQLVGRFEPVLDRRSPLVIHLDATELKTIYDDPFYSREISDKDQFFWYTAYSDGILRLEFSAGVEPRELESFLRIINLANQEEIGSDDDTVTLLWELNAAHIDYFSVEGFVDTGQDDFFGGRSEPDAIDLVTNAAIEPGGEDAGEVRRLFENMNLDHLDIFTRMQIEAHAKVVVPELRDQDLAYAFTVEPELIDRLYEEWRSGVDLEYRLIEALLSIIRAAPESEAGRRAGQMIQRLTTEFIDERMFEQAARVLDLLRDRRQLFSRTDVDPLGELLADLSEPLRLDALINQLQKEAGVREAIAEVLSLLDQEAVQLQILRAVADEDRPTLAYGRLFDILEELETADAALVMAQPDFVENPTYLKRMLDEISHRDHSKWPAAPRLIHAAVRDERTSIKEAALRVPHSCWSDPTLAEKYLVPLATDPDETLRKLALELLGEKHPNLFRDAIRDSLLAREFMGRTHAELRFLMRVFLENVDDAEEFLRSLLDTRGWFGKAAREFAKMAADVLLEAGDEKAEAYVREQVDSFWTFPGLRKSYEASLRKHELREQAEEPEPKTAEEPAPPEPGDPPPPDTPSAQPGRQSIDAIELDGAAEEGEIELEPTNLEAKSSGEESPDREES